MNIEVEGWMGFFSAIGDAVGTVADAISDVADAVGLDVVADAVGLDDIYDAVANLGVGGWLNDLSDSLGLPDWFGDVAGAIADGICGNPLGAVANGLDALEDVALACDADTLAGFLKAGAGLSEAFMGDLDAFTSLTDPGELFGLARESLGDFIHGDVTPYLHMLDPAYNGGIVSDIAHSFIIRP